jgi:hypothetical protein
MSLSTSIFSLQELEARFEMQCMGEDSGGGRFYNEQHLDACGGGGGAAYDYYGSSWGDAGSGEGYIGTYQTSGDGSYAILDDGSYTDGTSGDFPSYEQNGSAMATEGGGTDVDTTDGQVNGIGIRSYCVLCRCRF